MSKSEGINLEDLKVDLNYKSQDGTLSVNDHLRELAFQRNERVFLISTDDNEVRKALEYLGQPVSLVNEDNRDRRERLILLLTNDTNIKNRFEIYKKSFTDSQSDESTQPNKYYNDSDVSENDKNEEFYTPASIDLILARQFLIQDSITKSKKRLRNEQSRARSFNIGDELRIRRKQSKIIQSFQLSGSQIVTNRPVSKVRLSKKNDFIAAGSWGGDVQVIHADTLERISKVENPYSGKIGGMDWNNNDDMLIFGGEDGLVKLFSFDGEKLESKSIFYGHESRVADVKFHPSYKYAASASFDMTWRLWDVNTSKELLLQEGHAKEVYCISMQNDGSLVCSAGLDSTGIIWDIRSGKSIMNLRGHAKPIYSVDWSPDCHEVVTGSGDGTIKVWDIRNPSQPDSILAHKSLVTDVQFEKSNGKFLISSGYDKKINIYSSGNWNKVSSLEGHTDKVLSVSISEDLDTVVSAGWDRSVKLWSNE